VVEPQADAVTGATGVLEPVDASSGETGVLEPPDDAPSREAPTGTTAVLAPLRRADGDAPSRPAAAQGSGRRPPASPAATLIDRSRDDRRPTHRHRLRRGVALGGIAVLVVGAAGAFLASRPATTTVPRLTGLHEHTIRRLADRDHLRAHFQRRFASQPKGTSFAQNPQSGTQVNRNTPVTVLISAGPRPVAVPNVVGRGSSQASVAIHAAGLLTNVTTVAAPGVTPGTVVSQQPSAPATATPGSTIALQEAAVPSWHTVTSFSGTDGGQSVPFRIRGNRWQVRYDMQYQGTCTFFVICFGPHLAVQSTATGATVKGMDLATGNNNTQSFKTGPGVYQLQVSAGQDSADWSITVQDLY
jgi:hypothetical protein